MHHPAFRPALYSCPFLGCKKTCKKPSGLTRHQNTCEFNPKNQFTFPEPDDAIPPAGILPTPSPPLTPPPQLGPIEVPPQNIWKKKSRSGIYVKKHPYLDGELALVLSVTHHIDLSS